MHLGISVYDKLLILLIEDDLSARRLLVLIVRNRNRQYGFYDLSEAQCLNTFPNFRVPMWMGEKIAVDLGLLKNAFLIDENPPATIEFASPPKYSDTRCDGWVGVSASGDNRERVIGSTQCRA